MYSITGKIKFKILSCIFIVGVFFFISYGYFSGKEYVVEISEAQIQEKLKRNLPFSKVYLGIFDVDFSKPRITIDDESHRLFLGLDMNLKIKRAINEKVLKGSSDVSGVIDYNPSNGSFYLKEPKIEFLSIEGLSNKYVDKVDSFSRKTINDYLESNPIYTLKYNDIKQLLARLFLKRIDVKNSRISIIFGI